MIGFQVIGASPEECYGEGIPVKSDSNSDDLSDDEESWWEKRHEEFEEIIAEQIKEAQEKARAQKELAWANYLTVSWLVSRDYKAFLLRVCKVDRIEQIYQLFSRWVCQPTRTQ